MKQIDLDDLPPRVARILLELGSEESLDLVQGGVIVGRVRGLDLPAAPAAEGAEVSPEERLREVMEQFNAMIHDEF